MDLTDTIVPKSDQLNADDLMSGPRTFTITKVERGSDEQPVNVYLAEFPSGRPWRPSKSMLRVLVMVWGKESSAYVGRRLTLYRDPEITFGPDKVGGVRISHMSHITKRQTMALTVKRGSRKPFTVEPLPDDTPSSPPLSETDVRRAALKAEWKTATPERRKEIEAEAAALDGSPSPTHASGELEQRQTQVQDALRPRSRVHAGEHLLAALARETRSCMQDVSTAPFG
jgi:hypothetical protein